MERYGRRPPPLRLRSGGEAHGPAGEGRQGPEHRAKGAHKQPGGQWKLELVGAQPRCVFRGMRGGAMIKAGQRVDDNTWHRLECRRIGRTVTLRVDGVVVASASAATGRIRNNAPVRVGERPSGRPRTTTSTTVIWTTSSTRSNARVNGPVISSGRRRGLARARRTSRAASRIVSTTQHDGRTVTRRDHRGGAARPAQPSAWACPSPATRPARRPRQGLDLPVCGVRGGT